MIIYTFANVLPYNLQWYIFITFLFIQVFILTVVYSVVQKAFTVTGIWWFITWCHHSCTVCTTTCLSWIYHNSIQQHIYFWCSQDFSWREWFIRYSTKLTGPSDELKCNFYMYMYTVICIINSISVFIQSPIEQSAMDGFMYINYWMHNPECWLVAN